MVLVGQGLRAAQVHYSLVCTPLAPISLLDQGKVLGDWQQRTSVQPPSVDTPSQNAPVAHTFNTPAPASVQPPVGRVEHP